MAASRERPPERDGGERVAGIAERGEQEALRPGGAQASSASSRVIRSRDSKSNAIGPRITVPTPASR